MLRSTLALTVLFAAPVAHADEVSDVLLLAGEQQLWIALEGQPEALDFQSASGRLTLTLSGFQALNARSITPAVNGSIARVDIEPGQAGTRLTLEGTFAVAQAELRQGGILIDWSGGPYPYAVTQPAAPVAEAEPAAPHTAMARPTGPSQAEPTGETLYAIAEPADPSPEPISQPRQGEGAAAQIATAVPDDAPQRSTPRPLSPTAPSDLEPMADTLVTEVDPSSVPGETALVEVEPDMPGPCDPTAAAVASSPWDLDGLAAHAACLIEIGETVNGAGLYERVLAFDPSHFQAALGLARLRERQGRRADAARLFETAADAALTDGQALAARQSARRLRE